jgi:hypothetical protein
LPPVNLGVRLFANTSLLYKLGITMDEMTYRIEYISPAIVRGEDGNDFLLDYHEDGNQMSFSGRLPHNDIPGNLDFPSQSTWPSKAPEWAKGKRTVIESRLLEYSSEISALKWVSPSNFGPRPSFHPLPTDAEAKNNVAMVEVARRESEATLKQSTATQRIGRIMLMITVAAFVLFVAVKLLSTSR